MHEKIFSLWERSHLSVYGKHVRLLVPLTCIVLSVLILSIPTSVGAASRLEPQVSITETGVQISFTTAHPSGQAQLFWTDTADSDPPSLMAFPEYRYAMSVKGIQRTHSFALPFQPDPSKRSQVIILPGRTIHFRVTCIEQMPDALYVRRSKDYAFRVIKTQEGEPIPGLVFTDGPFVANVLADRATVCWETNLPAQGAFSYRKAGQDPAREITVHEPNRRFNITLEHLKPNTQYYYQIKCSRSDPKDVIQSSWYSFVTAAKRGQPFKFAVMGDSRANSRTPDPDTALNGVNVPTLNTLSRQALQRGARFVLFSGDLINGYTNDLADIALQYRTWRMAVNPINAFIPYYSTMGNHDTTAPWPVRDKNMAGRYAEDIWRDFHILPENGPLPEKGLPPYTENVYSFNYGGCHFVALNSDYYFLRDLTPEDRFGRTIDLRQREWLKMVLEENKHQRFTFVFFHSPAYPNSAHVRGSLDRLPSVRDALWKILDDYKVDAVFCGHEHNYCRMTVDHRVNPNWTQSIVQIIAGRAGAPWYGRNTKVPWADSVQEFRTDTHFVMASVAKRSVTFEAYNELGKLIDTFTIRKKKK
jgi:3',5'-cyclic AMP phosphodiesterase CpdA